MKIKKKLLKNFFIQNLLAFVFAIYIIFVKVTSKITYLNLSIPQTFWNKEKPFILAFWHNQLMTISYGWKTNKKISILASSHSDGRFGALVGKYFNLDNIPTSKDGSSSAIRTVNKKIKEQKYIGITPDGPRGPKENVSEGIIKIAKISNAPIIPCGYWSSKNFQLNSWDSFLITLPFSKCCFVWEKPIYIPKEINDNEIKIYQNLLNKQINKCIERAKKFK